MQHRQRGWRWGTLLVLGVSLTACAPWQEGNVISLPRLQLWKPADRSIAPGPAEAQRRVASSVWSVTQPTGAWRSWFWPQAARGSAVAIASDQLLAACDAAQGKELVGVARRSSMRLARVRGVGADGRLCILRVPDAEIGVVRAYRPFADLQVGEPLIAVTSQTSRRYVISHGRLVAKGSSADSYLETTLAAPPGASSVAVFDAFGNLVGLGAPGAMPGSLLVAFPVPLEAASQLTAARIGESPEVQKALRAMPQPTARSIPVSTGS